MDVKDVLKLVHEYNAVYADEMFERMADDIICQTLEQMNKMLSNGNWKWLIEIDYFAVSISVNSKFETLISINDWFLYGESPKDYEGDLVHFDEKLLSSEKELTDCEIGDFQNQEVKRLFPLVKALEKRGFECYISERGLEAFVKVK